MDIMKAFDIVGFFWPLVPVLLIRVVRWVLFDSVIVENTRLAMLMSIATTPGPCSRSCVDSVGTVGKGGRQRALIWFTALFFCRISFFGRFVVELISGVLIPRHGARDVSTKIRSTQAMTTTLWTMTTTRMMMMMMMMGKIPSGPVQTSRAVRALSSFLCLCLLLSQLPTVAASQHDLSRDTGELCQEKAAAEYCIKDPNTFFECPIACMDHLRPEHASWGGYESHTDPPFYDFSVNGVDFDRFEGMITIVAAIPLYPGLIDYYHVLLQRLQDINPYLVDIVLIPTTGQDGIELKDDVPDEAAQTSKKKKKKVLVLRRADKVVDYLQSNIQEGKFDPTKPNVFIVSPQGDHIQMHIAPTMTRLQDMIRSQTEREL